MTATTGTPWRLELKQYSILQSPSLSAGERTEAATILVIVVVFTLLKRFYAGFYCRKAPDCDRRRRASSDARRARTRPRNRPSEQPPASRRSFHLRFRRQP